MIKQRIMYVCSECAEGCPEACGHYDRTELRVMPDGAWLCESCFDNNDDNEFLSWGHLPAPEEYGRIPASAQGTGKDDLAAADPGTITRNLRGLASRMEYRVEAIEQRDGDGAGAIQGRGIGIGYLLAKDLANALTEAATYIEGLRAVKSSELTEGVRGTAPLREVIMGAARLHTHDHTLALKITDEIIAALTAARDTEGK